MDMKAVLDTNILIDYLSGYKEAEKEISQYAGGIKLLMLRAQIVEFVGKNKKGLGLGALLLGLGIYLYYKKK